MVLWLFAAVQFVAANLTNFCCSDTYFECNRLISDTNTSQCKTQHATRRRQANSGAKYCTHCMKLQKCRLSHRIIRAKLEKESNSIHLPINATAWELSNSLSLIHAQKLQLSPEGEWLFYTLLNILYSLFSLLCSLFSVLYGITTEIRVSYNMYYLCNRIVKGYVHI